LRKVLNLVMNEGETELRIDGYIVADEDKWIYDWFEYPAICPKDVTSVLKELEGKPLTVKINSYGGDVWSGSVIYTALKDYKGYVTVKVDGLAASAASVIAMSGDKIMMSPTAQMMIHNASSSASGDYRDMEQAAEFLKNVNSAISNAYMVKSGMDKDALLDLMDKETWLTAQEALDYKLIDEMMFADELATPDVTNMLKSKAQNVYACFNMPSKQSIDELKKLLPNPDNGAEDDEKKKALKTAQDKAKALLAIEKNRY